MTEWLWFSSRTSEKDFCSGSRTLSSSTSRTVLHCKARWYNRATFSLVATSSKKKSMYLWLILVSDRFQVDAGLTLRGQEDLHPFLKRRNPGGVPASARIVQKSHQTVGAFALQIL